MTNDRFFFISDILGSSKRRELIDLPDYIDKGIPPPNRPITLSGGWMRNPVSKKPVKVKGKSGTTPLVDTGQLHNDFDFAIAGK